jgi:hypothetical protein
MDRRAATRAFAELSGTPRYRAEILRRDLGGHVSTYYNGGELSPYCIESLIELLRGEAHTPYQSLELSLEFRGKCSPALLRDVAKRFASVQTPRLQISIRAAGQQPVVIGAGEPPPSDIVRSGNGC